MSRMFLLLSFDLGLGDHVNHKWRTAMSAATDAMTAAVNTLKQEVGQGNSGLTTQQITDTVHTVVDPEVAALTAQLAAIQASEADDATKNADTAAAVKVFTDAFAPAAAPATPLPSTLPPAGGSGGAGTSAGTDTSGAGSGTAGQGA